MYIYIYTTIFPFSLVPALHFPFKHVNILEELVVLSISIVILTDCTELREVCFVCFPKISWGFPPPSALQGRNTLQMAKHFERNQSFFISNLICEWTPCYFFVHETKVRHKVHVYLGTLFEMDKNQDQS